MFKKGKKLSFVKFLFGGLQYEEILMTWGGLLLD